MDAHNRWLGELGHPRCDLPPRHRPGREFGAMLDKERVDVAIVTTVDATHDDYIVAALAADGTW
jgi:predicted dehydrogenase